jgi:N-acetylmuramoyl-L-alanine amidase
VQELKKKLDIMDVKAYYTRMEDTAVSPQERARLAESVSADMFISVGVAGDKDSPEKYGISCLYNHLYFIPGLGNLELADLLERHVVAAVSGRAEGLIEAPRDNVLAYLKVPGVQLRAGYLTNPDEAYLLHRQEYMDRLTDGIISAIDEAYLLLEGDTQESTRRR